MLHLLHLRAAASALAPPPPTLGTPAAAAGNPGHSHVHLEHLISSIIGLPV